MSTTSHIFVKLKPQDGAKAGAVYAGVYCHWDGYPAGVGQMLLDHYNSYEKALELIKGGNMSKLRKTIGDTIYYRDDKGELANLHKFCIVLFNEGNIINDMRGELENFLYLFEDGKWYVYDCTAKRMRRRNLKNLLEKWER